MGPIDKKTLYEWYKIPAEELADHSGLKIPLRIVKDSEEMGAAMARKFADEILRANEEGRPFRVIVPCGPKAWYEPFTKIVNDENISLQNMTVFHMDECLDWEGKLLARNDPYNFRTFMEKHFYGGIRSELAVPPERRIFPEPSLIEEIKARIAEAPPELTLGGWGQDGHLAYNQARRHPFSPITVEQLRNSEIRVQDNNLDTILALAHRTYGAAYQFVPPMSITLGMKECLSAKKVRINSDTGAWKQTALRVALFSEEIVDYPITMLQNHPDALITATWETARHPISENPDWEFNGVNV
jgi:glucosamine-6-phosphate deaminase